MGPPFKDGHISVERDEHSRYPLSSRNEVTAKGIRQNTTVLYPTLLYWWWHVLPLGHLQIAKMYIDENYTEYDHSMVAYSKLSTRSCCWSDYTHWAKSTSPLL